MGCRRVVRRRGRCPRGLGDPGHELVAPGLKRLQRDRRRSFGGIQLPQPGKLLAEFLKCHRRQPFSGHRFLQSGKFIPEILHCG